MLSQLSSFTVGDLIPESDHKPLSFGLPVTKPKFKKHDRPKPKRLRWDKSKVEDVSVSIADIIVDLHALVDNSTMEISDVTSGLCDKLYSAVEHLIGPDVAP